MASVDAELTNKDYAAATRKYVTLNVTVKPTVLLWWRFRLSLAVHIARLAAWVGGTSFVINREKNS